MFYDLEHNKVLNCINYTSKVYCNYLDSKDAHKRPLSKLISDIAKELGLLEYIESKE